MAPLLHRAAITNTTEWQLYPIWLSSIRCCLPQRNTITPDVRLGIKLEKIDTLRRIPFQWPFSSCFRLHT